MFKLALATSLFALLAGTAVADEVIVSAQTFTQDALKSVLEQYNYTKETGDTVTFEFLVRRYRGHSKADHRLPRRQQPL